MGQTAGNSLKRWGAKGGVILFFSLVIGAGGCGLPAGGGGGALLNAFTRSGLPLTIDRMVADAGSASASSQLQAPFSTSQTYFGRALIKNGGTVYGATIRFTLNKDSNIAAYFSNFQILRLVVLNGFSNAVPLISSPVTISVNAGLNSATNALTILDTLERTANFNLDFGNNTYLSDVVSAGVVVSDDFRTLAGGDQGTFFFIAQKATDVGSATSFDLDPLFTLIEFSVSGAGRLQFRDLWSLSSVGTGGRGYTAFRGTTPAGGLKEGEFNLVDSGTGIFVLGLDTVPGDGSPRADGTVDGAFLLSPDRTLVLAYDLVNSAYWAGSR